MKTLNPPATLPGAGYLPGLLLVAILTAVAYALRMVPGLGIFSPLILGIIVGMIYANCFSLPASADKGVRFAGRQVMRAGVALLGFQITLSQVGELGIPGLAVAAIALFSTFYVTLWLGARVGVPPKLAALIAAGSSICGASAIAAADLSVRAKDEDVAYAVSCVTIFGTAAMFLLPLLASFLPISATEFGVWAGASIHEVAQVVGAGAQHSEEALGVATVVKLSRVLMLAPLLLVLGLIAARFRAGESEGARPPLVPAFLIAFIAIMLVNSTGIVPEGVRQGFVTLTAILLSAALTALGLGTNFRQLRKLGIKPLILGAMAWVWITGVGLLGAALLF